ncbi:MAG: hypothetical protein AVDCRST_MAG16-1145, partial [uncultured Frankineae bacterium]
GQGVADATGGGGPGRRRGGDRDGSRRCPAAHRRAHLRSRHGCPAAVQGPAPGAGARRRAARPGARRRRGGRGPGGLPGGPAPRRRGGEGVRGGVRRPARGRAAHRRLASGAVALPRVGLPDRRGQPPPVRPQRPDGRRRPAGPVHRSVDGLARRRQPQRPARRPPQRRDRPGRGGPSGARGRAGLPRRSGRCGHGEAARGPGRRRPEGPRRRGGDGPGERRARGAGRRRPGERPGPGGADRPDALVGAAPRRAAGGRHGPTRGGLRRVDRRLRQRADPRRRPVPAVGHQRSDAARRRRGRVQRPERQVRP